MKKTAIIMLLAGSLLLTSCTKNPDITETTEESEETSRITYSSETTQEQIIDKSFIYKSENGYEDYIVTSYKFADDGLSADMTLKKILEFTDEEINSIKPGETKIKGYTVTDIEKYEDNNTMLEIEGEYFYLRPQENSKYYLYGPDGYCYENAGTKNLIIDSNLYIFNDDFDLTTEGVVIDEDATRYKDTTELTNDFDSRNMKAYPDLYIRVEQDLVKFIATDIGDEEYNNMADKDTKDYFVTDFDLADDGLSGTFKLNEITKYSKKDLSKIKNINAFYEGRETIISTIDGKETYQLQANGSYYKMDSDVPIYKEGKKKTLKISSDVVIYNDCHSFTPNGIEISADDQTFRTVKDFIKAIKEDEISAKPDLLIRVKNGEVYMISINPAAHDGWHMGSYADEETTSYTDYYCVSYKLNNGILSSEFEVATPITYTRDQVNAFATGKTKILNDIISKIEKDPDTSTVYLEAGDNSYRLGLQSDGTYMLFKNGMPCYDKTEKVTIPLDPDVKIYTDADPYTEKGILLYSETPSETMEDLKNALTEREEEGFTPLVIHVVNNKITTIVVYPYSDASIPAIY